MSIQVTKRPYKYCFSGNPVHYELFSAAAAADLSIYFEVQVHFTSVAGSVVTDAFEYAAINGYAEVNIQAILEGLVSYDLPDFAGPETTVRPAPDAMGSFYLAFREITPQNATPTYDTSEEDFACFVVKGGVSRFKYQGNNFFTQYYNADVPFYPRPFLTWQKNGRLAAYKERMYLAYLLTDDVGQGMLAPDVFATVTYIDGSTVTLNNNFPLTKNRIYYVPAGAAQWGFSRAKQIWYWEIYIAEGSPLSETFRFYADNRHDENDISLHYRNSLGGLDSVRIRGVIEYNLEYTFEEQQRIQRPDYFNGHYYEPQRTNTNTKELLTYRGDLGFLDKEEQDRLRDAFQKREAWWEMGNLKWVPVNINNKSIKQKTSEDNRWNLPIDFTLAHEGDDNYTPPSVNIGSGTFTSNVCLAYLGSVAATVSDGPSGYKTVSVSFQEIDPENASTQIRWRVIKVTDGTVVLPWTQIAFASPVVFNVPAGDYYLWEAQAVCANAVYGKKTQLNITAVANSGGVTPNSKLSNQRNNGAYYEIRRDGVLIDQQFLGANSNNNFSCAAGTGVTIVVNFAFFSPGAAVIWDGVTSRAGSIVNNMGFSAIITFPPINITSQGIIITIY